jgi:gamma-glutamyltranspeptidase/glutathione hydrolase
MSPLLPAKARVATRQGQRTPAAALALGLTLVLALAGCATRPPVGEVGNVSGAIGGAATEEPSAALVARDALSAGGTAADAAVAAFFAMAVSYPVAVGIGGGGLCMVYDAATNTAETLDFRPGASGTRELAVPGSLRGMAALHARYGRLPWEQLIGQAEANARFGVPMSRALAREVAESEAIVRADPGLAALFVDEKGELRGESDPLVQVELAALLGRVRSRGIGDFYGGEAGRAFVDAVRQGGGGLTLEELRDYRAQWRPTIAAEYANITFHSPLPLAGRGTLLATLMRDLPAEPGPAELAAVTSAAYGLAQIPPGDPDRAGEASLATIDRRGSAVACTFTMRGDFGAGRLARASGVILVPDRPEMDRFLAPLVGANQNLDQAYFAGAASGGWGAPIAVARVARALVRDGGSLETLVQASRLVRPAVGGPVLAEPALLAEAQAALPGQAVEPWPAIGRLHAVWCPNGAKSNPELCRAAADRRGFGLAVDGG